MLFRSSFFTLGTSISGIKGTYANKWQKFYSEIPIIRLADMYLTRGEANFHLGTGTPDADINIVRARAKAGPLSGATLQDFVDERFREFAFEGDRFFTLKRLKMDVSGVPYDDPTLILPLPQAEIDVNNKLVQNDGY